MTAAARATAAANTASRSRLALAAPAARPRPRDGVLLGICGWLARLAAAPTLEQRDRFRSIGEPSPATRSHGDRGPLIASASSQVFDLGRKRRW